MGKSTMTKEQIEAVLIEKSKKWAKYYLQEFQWNNEQRIQLEAMAETGFSYCVNEVLLPLFGFHYTAPLDGSIDSTMAVLCPKMRLDKPTRPRKSDLQFAYISEQN